MGKPVTEPTNKETSAFCRGFFIMVGATAHSQNGNQMAASGSSNSRKPWRAIPSRISSWRSGFCEKWRNPGQRDVRRRLGHVPAHVPARDVPRMSPRHLSAAGRAQGIAPVQAPATSMRRANTG